MKRTKAFWAGVAFGFILDAEYLLVLLLSWNKLHFMLGGSYDSLVHHFSVRLPILGTEIWPEIAGLMGLIFPLAGGILWALLPPRFLSQAKFSSSVSAIIIGLMFFFCSFLFMAFTAV